MSCCPMNLARLIESIGGYIYSVNTETLFVHLFAESETVVSFGTKKVQIKMQTEYPWDSKIIIRVKAEEVTGFRLGIRIPYFGTDAKLYVDGEKEFF